MILPDDCISRHDDTCHAALVAIERQRREWLGVQARAEAAVRNLAALADHIRATFICEHYQAPTPTTKGPAQ